MMLSDMHWFDNTTEIQPFKFTGGCILPPNQLVIPYRARNTSDDEVEKKNEDEEHPQKCRNPIFKKLMDKVRGRK